MTKNQQLFLSTLFNPDEEIYASPDKYSSSWDKEKQQWKIYRPSILQTDIPENTNLISINPLKGNTRSDQNVTSFRNFLVEMDEGSLAFQLKTVDDTKLPYSLAVFSGGKSIHFAVCLSESLPSIEVYKFYAEWILNTVPKADLATKNPSRAIRYPDVVRNDSPSKKIQKLVKQQDRISFTKLRQYLSFHIDKMPQPEKQDHFDDIEENDKAALANWLVIGMKKGFDFSIGRNNRWFAVGVEFAKCGFSLTNSIDILEKVFAPDPDFSRTEWTAAIKSGFSHGLKKYRK
jgi:hypothetical protein